METLFFLFNLKSNFISFSDQSVNQALFAYLRILAAQDIQLQYVVSVTQTSLKY